MDKNTLLMYLAMLDDLPVCKHGNHVCDWSGEPLEPLCGCRLRLTPVASDGAGVPAGDVEGDTRPAPEPSR